MRLKSRINLLLAAVDIAALVVLCRCFYLGTWGFGGGGEVAVRGRWMR